MVSPLKSKLGSTRGNEKRKEMKVNGKTTFSSGALRRLARRGGVKRISKNSYPLLRSMIIRFLESVVKDSMSFMELAKRKTVLLRDVGFALARFGKSIYGFS